MGKEGIVTLDFPFTLFPRGWRRGRIFQIKVPLMISICARHTVKVLRARFSFFYFFYTTFFNTHRLFGTKAIHASDMIAVLALLDKFYQVSWAI